MYKCLKNKHPIKMMSIKRALRFHLVRMVSAKKTKDYVVKRVGGGEEPLRVRTQACAATVEISMEAAYKTKNRTTA